MIYGLYLSTNGSLVQMARQEAIANNLANTTTPGFKEDVAILKQVKPRAKELGLSGSRLNRVHERIGGRVMMDSIREVNQPGIMQATGNPLDVAINGDGFLEVERTINGSERTFYTRSGAMKVDNEGFLAMANGLYRIRDEAGFPIHVVGNNVSVSNTGDIVVDNAVVARLKTVKATDTAKLVKKGNSVYEDPQKEAGIYDAELSMRNGYIEGSAVKPVKEMIKMIEGMRAYEANMRMISLQDGTLGRLVNDVGRIPA